MGRSGTDDLENSLRVYLGNGFATTHPWRGGEKKSAEDSAVSIAGCMALVSLGFIGSPE